MCELASLTKIMTCHVTLNVCNRLNIDKKDFFIRISDYAGSMTGTIANLYGGDLINLEDILFGLMLPSGNDAAWALAENIGILLWYEKLNLHEKLQKIINGQGILLMKNTFIFKFLFL